MAFAFRGREVGYKDTGHAANVPDNPRARLMYYLNSVASVLKSDTVSVDQKYIDYMNYSRLSDKETRTLISNCEKFSPAFMEGKGFSHSPALCEGKSNRFLDISSKDKTLVAVEEVVVFGIEAIVVHVMVYTDSWKEKYYDDPLYKVKISLRPPSPVYTYTTRRRSSSCIII